MPWGRTAAGRYVTSNHKYKGMKDKDEAIREWVAREFSTLSQEWVRIAMEHSQLQVDLIF